MERKHGCLLAGYDQFIPSLLHPNPSILRSNWWKNLHTGYSFWFVLSKEGIPKFIQKKVTTYFLKGHESPGTFCSRPNEANLVICSCSRPYFLLEERCTDTNSLKTSQSLICASHSGEGPWSALIVVAGLHLSLELGFWDSCIALNCSLSVKKDVGLSFAHFLDTAYIQLWVIAVDPKT